MLHVLNETLDVFGLFWIVVEFIAQKLSELIFVGGWAEFIRGFLSRNHKFKLVCMTQNYSVQMLDLLLFSDLETVHKNFGLRFGDDEELFSLLNDWTVALVDAQCVDLDVVFFNFCSTNWCLALLEPIDQQASDSRIFRDVDDVRVSLLLLHVGTSDDWQTSLFQCFISAVLKLLFPFSFFLELLFDFLLGFHLFSKLWDFIFQKQNFVLVLNLNHFHVVHVNCFRRFLDNFLIGASLLKLSSKLLNLSTQFLIRSFDLNILFGLSADLWSILGKSKGWKRLIVIETCRGQCSYQECLAVTSKGLCEDLGQYWLSVRDVLLFTFGTVFCQDVDYSTQCWQTFVDSGTFFGPVTGGSRSFQTFWPCQIHDVVLAVEFFGATLLRIVNSENSMTSRGIFVHFCRTNNSEWFTLIK